jgi:broad specificity phosphatase PhoE
VTVHRDPRIAQCLSEKQRRDPQISPQTRAQITIDEGPHMFRQRVALHVAEARVQGGVVWCITHQAVIEEVTRHFREKISRSFDFLDHVVMLG